MSGAGNANHRPGLPRSVHVAFGEFLTRRCYVAADPNQTFMRRGRTTISVDAHSRSHAFDLSRLVIALPPIPGSPEARVFGLFGLWRAGCATGNM